jgi:hypothetical protein
MGHPWSVALSWEGKFPHWRSLRGAEAPLFLVCAGVCERYRIGFPSGAKARIETIFIAALKRCATQRRSTARLKSCPSRGRNPTWSFSDAARRCAFKGSSAPRREIA